MTLMTGWRMSRKRVDRIVLKRGNDPGVAYLELPDHPHVLRAGLVKKTIRLHDLIEYVGVDVYLNFDEDDRLVGIEIVE